MHDGQQIPLALTTSELPSFSNFVVGLNDEVVMALRNFARAEADSLIFLYGQAGTGVSHLLQASSHLAAELGKKSLYLSLAEPGLNSKILKDLDFIDHLYLDDVQSIAGDENWEEDLFHLFNQFRDGNKCLLIAAKQLPEQLSVTLPDLKSRLSGMVRYHLKKLTDKEKSVAIIIKAQALGLKLSSEVSNFILTRGPRDLRELMQCIHKLDQASMISKRAITIPFVKQTLDW